MRYRRRPRQPMTDAKGGTPQKVPRSSHVKAALSVLLPGTAGLALLIIATRGRVLELVLLLLLLGGVDVILFCLAHSHDTRRG